MMSIELGSTVVRELPLETLSGLASGALKTYGGVIRDEGGRIVAHLAMPAVSALNMVPALKVAGAAFDAGEALLTAVGLQQIQEATERVLDLTIASTALSGLGIVGSVAGSAFLSTRIRRIDSRLGAIEKQTRAIRDFLQSSQRAQLMTAVDHYRLAQQASDVETRRHLLLQSKQGFTALAHHYAMQLDGLSDLAEIGAVEESYTLARLGSVMATSDLGIPDAAREDMRNFYDEWKIQARKQCSQLLIGESPVRLLESRYIKMLPTTRLIQLLDFAHDSRKGIGWIDELRKDLDRTSILRGTFSQVEQPVIDQVNKLLARNDILQGLVAHTGFLADRSLSMSQFAQHVESVCEGGGARFLIWSEPSPASQTN